MSVCGGSLQGKRVLDLGCNAGFWSLQAIEAGADFVLGVDDRQDYIEQASLVFEAKGIDPARYRFEQGNVFKHQFAERFDVVLCLGLLSVVAKPVALFELMRGVGAELVVIDTSLSPAPLRSGFFEVSRLSEPRNAVDYELVLVPSARPWKTSPLSSAFRPSRWRTTSPTTPAWRTTATAAGSRSSAQTACRWRGCGQSRRHPRTNGWR